MLNKSRQQERALPRIQSQKRVNTAFQRKENGKQQIQNKNQVNNRQLKRTFSASNNCKAAKYENTGIIYAKKIQQLQMQNSLIDRQILKVQQQINETKKLNLKQSKASQSVRCQNIMITQTTLHTDSKVSAKSNMNINMNDQKSVAIEIRKVQNKIANMRKKIDEQGEKNRKVRNEVDAVRKEITTLKNLNKNLASSLQKTNQQYNQYAQLSKTLDQQITNKNLLMHKTKVQNQHKKAQIIKHYDQILRHLQKQLEKDKTKNKAPSQASQQILFFTQFGNGNAGVGNKQIETHNIHSFSRNARQSLRRSNKINISSQIGAIKSKLDRYQKQFESVKIQTGTRNTEQAIKQFYGKYQKNFSFYKYINELHLILQQRQKQNKQLRAKKDDILQQATVKNSQIGVRDQQAQNIKISLDHVKSQKMKYSKICQNYQRTLQQMKSLIQQYYSKIDMKDNLDVNDLKQNNIVNFLYSIKQRCNQLDSKYECFRSNNETHNASYQQQHCFLEQNNTANVYMNNTDVDITQILQQIKRETSNQESTDSKTQRLMSRQQFLKSRELFMKKRQTPRKNLINKR